MVDSDSNTLRDNTIEDNDAGIYLSSSDSNSIYDNIISNNDENGVYLFSGSTSNHIYDNTISNNNPYGIRIVSSTVTSLNKILFAPFFKCRVFGSINRTNFKYFLILEKKMNIKFLRNVTFFLIKEYYKLGRTMPI